MSLCAEAACDRKSHARGYCHRHYVAARRRGVLPPLTPEDRFARSFEVTERGCWEWTAHKDRKGYGLLAIGGSRKARAHRWAWERYVGPLAGGEQVHHRCLNPSCVNPSHLEAVTNAENQRRRWAVTHRCCDCGSQNVERIGDLDLTIT